MVCAVAIVATLAACTSDTPGSVSRTTQRPSTSVATAAAAVCTASPTGDGGTGERDPGLGNFDGTAGPVVAWALPVGGIDVDSDQIDGIAVDDDGNTAISGVFHDRVDIGDRVLTSRGKGDIFVASIAPDGSVRWTRHYGGAGDDNTYDLKVDGAGNILLSGWFTGTVDFGGIELTAKGSVDAFVAKVARDGAVSWARSFGGTQGDGANEIAVSADGAIAVSAITAGDFEVDGVTHRFGGGMRDSYVLRLEPDGSLRWVHHFDGPGNERIRAIALGADGHIAVGFEFRGRMRSGEVHLDAKGGWDGALARLTPDGDLDWLQRVGGPGTDNVRGVGIAPEGSMYASGTIHGVVELLDRNQPAVGTGGDDYVAKVHPDGSTDWVVTLGGPESGTGGELQANGDGVVISGLLDGQVTVKRDGETLTRLSSPTGRPTGYLLGLDPDGVLRFSYSPSPAPPDGRAFGDVLGVSPDGSVVVQALRFGGTITVDEQTMTTPGNKDSAVVAACLGDH